MTSPVAKHSIIINGHKTSVSLEDKFWDALKRMAKDEKRTIRDLVEEIECDRLLKKWSNLSSCIRLFVLDGVMSGRAS